MTTPPIHPRDRADRPFVCRVCRGPCRAYKGTSWGWTCTACINEVLDEQHDR